MPVRYQPAAALAAALTIGVLSACGGGGKPQQPTSPRGSSSTTTAAVAEIPGLDELEKAVAALSADESLGKAGTALSSARSDLSKSLSALRDAIDAAQAQRKLNRWDCSALDAKRAAAWQVREQISGNLADVDAAADKLTSALSAFTGKYDDLTTAYDKVKAAADKLSPGQVPAQRMESAATAISAMAAQTTGAKGSLSSAKETLTDVPASADKQYGQARTFVTQCSNHWARIAELKARQKANSRG
ncbi:MAG: hypothetical protein V9G19_27080 [Tetrasphaera sp.]